TLGAQIHPSLALDLTLRHRVPHSLNVSHIKEYCVDLKEFISETMIQIISGVVEAQEQEKTIGGTVSPRLTAGSEFGAQHGFLRAEGGAAQIVQFDVALTAKEGSGTKGGIGIVSGIVSLGTSGQSQEENASVSRVKFSVPLILPHG
ncbi:MAG: hypothetical protein P8Z75_13490, partial [Gammaproteobacteria bacterium]